MSRMLYRNRPADGLRYRATGDGQVHLGDGRTIDLRIMAWGEVAPTNEGYRETFTRGAFAGVDPSRVSLESNVLSTPGTHDRGVIVGAATSIEERDDGAYATFLVAGTPAGDELLTLARSGPNGEPAVLRDASVVFRPTRSRRRADGVVERQSVDLYRVGLVERGAYRGAHVLAVRAAGTEDGMPCNLCGQEHAQGVTCPITAAIEARAASDVAPIITRIDGMEGRLERAIAAASVPQDATHPLAAYGSLAEFAAAAYAGHSAYGSIGDGDMLARSLADNITSENDGLMRPSWLNEVVGIVNPGRRVINAFGGPHALPATGMEIDWPTFIASNLDSIIGVQSTQKTEVTTRDVSFTKGSQAIATYAGASDIAYQLLQRSSPSYREQYERVMLAAWAKVTDAAFAAALEATSGTTTMTAGGALMAGSALATSANTDDIVDTTPDHGLAVGDPIVFTALTGGTGLTAGRVYWVSGTSLGAKTFRPAATPGGAPINFTTDITAGTVAKVSDTGLKLRASLFEASLAVEDATGAPATVVVAASDVFLALAGMSGIVPLVGPANPSNASGLAQASTLRIEVSGLTVVRSTAVTAGKVLVSNGLAAGWYEDGPKWATAEDVAKLGQNVAVYSFGAPASFIPAGIVELTFV